MSSLGSIYLKKDTLKTLLDTVSKKGEKGVEITLSIQDDTNEYDQNISAFVAQSKEQRERKDKKYYVGNGKIFWTDGNISISKKTETYEATVVSGNDGSDDLPF